MHDLSRAAAARMEALRTSGPARRPRLRSTQAELERLATGLPPDLRSQAIRLARCSDLPEADRLAAELTSGAPSDASPAKVPAPVRALRWLGTHVATAVISTLVGLAVTALIAYLFTRGESIGKQVDEVRAGLAGQGLDVRYEKVRLHQGGPSHLFVASESATAAAPRRSDEIRLYDEVDGSLEGTLRYRPEVASTDGSRATLATAFQTRAVRDIDGDGQSEILGVYEANLAGAEFQRVPIMIARTSAEEYELTPLLAITSNDREAVADLPAFRFQTGQSAWVSDLRLVTAEIAARRRSILVASVVPARTSDVPLTMEVQVRASESAPALRRQIRFWEVDMQGSAPRLQVLCLRPGEGSLVVTAPAGAKGMQTVLHRSLSDAAETGRLGSYADGHCSELAA